MDLLNKQYKLALNEIEGLTGLELTLIEKVNLKDMVKKSIQCNIGASQHTESLPYADAFYCFLQDYYGISPDFMGICKLCSPFEAVKAKAKVNKKKNPVPEYFRKKQEQAHRP